VQGVQGQPSFITINWYNHNGQLIETWPNSLFGWLLRLIRPSLPTPAIPDGYEFYGWFTEPQSRGLRESEEFASERNIMPLSARRIDENSPADFSAGHLWITPREQNVIGMNGLFRIRSTTGGHYMRASFAGSGGFIRANSPHHTRGIDLWAITSVPNSPGFYHIESLGVRDLYLGGSRNMVTGSASGANATTGSLSLVNFNQNRHDQQWSIHRAGNSYMIRNRQFSQLMINTESHIINLTNVRSDALWQFVSYTPTAFFGGRYAGSPLIGSPVTVRLGILPNAITNQLTMDVYNAGTAWNGISNNVQVNVIPLPSNIPTWPSGQSSFDVRVEGHHFINNDPNFITRGQFFPTNTVVGLGIPNVVMSATSNWHAGVILISHGSSAPNDMNTPDPPGRQHGHADRQSVFIHEVGHALKLRHPYYASPALFQWRPLSVMNQGLLDNDETVTARPSGYDRLMLIEKWGR